MTMLAHFEEPALTGSERRGSERRKLRLEVEKRAEWRFAAQVTIHDLSLTGVLIETSTSLSAGEIFEVDVPETGKVEATVVWNSGEFYGCQFREPISTAALSAALLRGPPRDAPPVSRRPPLDVVAELRSINEQVERIANEVGRAVGRLASKADD